MKTPVIAQVFRKDVADALIQASTVGRPGSVGRILAIEKATKSARRQQPKLFKPEY